MTVRARAAIASAIAYCFVTAVLGRDVLAHLSTTIVHDLGDPLLTTAILYWNAWTMPYSHAWWQFPIFYPTPDALAFSEHLLGLSVIATPIEWIVRNPLITANVATLLTFPLSAFGVFLLVRQLTGHSAGAFLAGLAFGFSPYRVSQLPHVQMLAAFWAPLSLLGLHAYLQSGKRRWLVLYAASWLLQSLANGYSLFFLSLLIALWVLWFVVALKRWIALRDIVVATLCAAVPLAPVLATYVGVHARHGFVRSVDDVRAFSADLAGLFCAPPDLTFWGWLDIGCRPEGELFPGLVLIGLAVLAGIRLLRPEGVSRGRSWSALVPVLALVVLAAALAAVAAVLVVGPWRIALGPIRLSASSADKPVLVAVAAALVALLTSRGAIEAVRRSSTTGFYLAGALAMWALALGPTVTLAGVPRGVPGPFALLMTLPGAAGFRAPARFWLMATLCLAVAAGLVVQELVARRKAATTAVVVALLSVGLLSDGWISGIQAVPAPAMYANASLLRGGAVLTLPAGNLQDFVPQYLAVLGGWRSVNGYSGYEPRYYEAVRQGGRFEVDGLFEPFLARGDLHVVVSDETPRLRQLVERQAGVTRLSEHDGTAIYRLPGRTTRPQPTPGARLHIARVESTCSPELTAAMLDGDGGTRWFCGPQSGHEVIVADLGTPAEVGSIRTALGERFADFPRELTIETSLDGLVWQTARQGDVIAATIEGGLAEPRRPVIVLSFAPRPARWVRLRQTAKDDQAYWSIAELEIWSGLEGGTTKSY